MLQILHNPRCGKSRNCLAFLNDSNTEFEIRNYIDNPLTVKELRALVKKLKIKPITLVRQKEAIWTENFQGKNMSDTEILKALAKHPILMERPILVRGDKAIIGRDLENVEKFL